MSDIGITNKEAHPISETIHSKTPQRVKLRIADEKQLREIGLWGNDELVISLRPSQKRNKRDVDK